MNIQLFRYLTLAQLFQNAITGQKITHGFMTRVVLLRISGVKGAYITL